MGEGHHDLHANDMPVSLAQAHMKKKKNTHTYYAVINARV